MRHQDSRTIPGDWYDGTLPDNVDVHEQAFLETTFSFHLYRSQEATGARFGKGCSVYLGTMFDVGPRGCVEVGDYALLNGVRIICDERIEIGAYALISWGVVLMDSHRLAFAIPVARRQLEHLAAGRPRLLEAEGRGRPIRIASNVWLGFDVCVLPGVSIGEGSVVGARSVVAADVEPYTIVAGNPARFVRRLKK